MSLGTTKATICPTVSPSSVCLTICLAEMSLGTTEVFGIAGGVKERAGWFLEPPGHHRYGTRGFKKGRESEFSFIFFMELWMWLEFMNYRVTRLYFFRRAKDRDP